MLRAGCSRRMAARHVECDPTTITRTAARDPQFAAQLRAWCKNVRKPAPTNRGRGGSPMNNFGGWPAEPGTCPQSSKMRNGSEPWTTNGSAAAMGESPIASSSGRPTTSGRRSAMNGRSTLVRAQPPAPGPLPDGEENWRPARARDFVQHPPLWEVLFTSGGAGRKSLPHNMLQRSSSRAARARKCKGVAQDENRPKATRLCGLFPVAFGFRNQMLVRPPASCSWT
jgi:hypothetical protein